MTILFIILGVVALVIAFSVIAMPFFVWGIYNSIKDIERMIENEQD